MAGWRNSDQMIPCSYELSYAAPSKAKLQHPSAVYSVILGVSLVINGFFIFSSMNWLSPNTESGVSIYSGLPRNVSKELPLHSDYWGSNETLANELWAQIPVDPGMVALDKVWTDSIGLPRGHDFPWERSKTVYLLNAYHLLHCLKMLHTSVREAYSNISQSQQLDHLQHCLNDMREDALCNADDTPRFTRPFPTVGTGADGQLRSCRDFSALESWAQQNTACYNVSRANASGKTSLMTLFSSCPPGSPYLPAIRKYFG